jgi:hypothetical protein
MKPSEVDDINKNYDVGALIVAIKDKMKEKGYQYPSQLAAAASLEGPVWKVSAGAVHQALSGNAGSKIYISVTTHLGIDMADFLRA